jgi:hypothetical protein
MAGYNYNPAEGIRQDFQQASSSLGNIFTQVIQQQQRDYALAENAFSNIEALKKDLNIYGQKSITSKANTLLGHASSAILQNGKLDYSKMGEIRQAVSDIKDLKTGYELGAKEYERMLQMGIANKDNLTSFESFYKDLSAKMSDENLIKNPRDLQNALLDTYTNNLNSQKMFDKFYLGMRPYEKGEFTYTDEKGNQVKVAGEAPTGWKRDAKGNVLPPEPITKTLPDGTVATVDYADEILSTIPTDLLAVMKKQAGPAAANMPDKELVKYFASRIPMTKSAIQVKSAAAIKGEESQADILETKAKYAERGEKADLNAKAASAAASWANAAYTNAKKDQEEVEMNYDPFAEFTKVSFKGGSTGKPVNLTKFPIGKDVSLNVNGQQGVVKSVARDENGGVWVEAWQNGRDQITANMDKSDRRAGFKWRKISNFDEFNTELAQEINIGAGIPTKQKAKIRKAIGTLYNLPTKTTNIVSAAPAQESMTNDEIIKYKPSNWTKTDSEFISTFKLKNNIK